MLPILLDITESFRPAGRGSGQQALFVPGESVQALVLEAQDPGKLMILVKGIPLAASSLAGPLEPGQVIQARVERANGQILLKLEQPLQAQSPQQPVPAAKSSQSQLAQVPPLPLSSVSARSAGPPGPVPAGPADLPVYGKNTSLLVQTGTTHANIPVRTGRVLPSVQARMEVKQPEPTEQPETIDRANRATQEADQETKPSSLASFKGPTTIQPFQPKGEGGLVATLSKVPEAVEAGKEAQANQGQVQGRSVQTPTSAHSNILANDPVNDPDPIPRLLRTLLPADESFDASFERLLRSVRTAVRHELLPDGVGSELEQLQERLVLKTGNISGPQVKEALLAKGLQHEQSLLPLLEKGGDGLKGAVEPTLKGWLLATLRAHARSPVAEPVETTGPAGAFPVESPHEPAQGPLAEWVKDAQHMLRVIEREQVLNSLNVQTGQPLLLEIPLGPWALSSAWLYVSRLEGEGGGRPQGRTGRPYNLVSLLELDGIGAVRVDALLTGKRIAVRFLVERQDIERIVAALLPTLSKGLSQRGYQVEALTAAVAEPSVIRGEELRARAVPSLSLVSLRA